MQARRLVKSSIIAVEHVGQQLDDEDFIEDNTAVTDYVHAHRGTDMPPAANKQQQGQHAATEKTSLLCAAL